jgi:malate dehydrogenase (oxaloacetate-decarboxylating)(NADP+)
MNIPVFHDDQHGTAIISAAAMLNGLKVVGKEDREGQGRLLRRRRGGHLLPRTVVRPRHRRENVTVCDSKGVIYVGRDANMEPTKARYAQDTEPAPWPTPWSAPTSSSACPPPAC